MKMLNKWALPLLIAALVAACSGEEKENDPVIPPGNGDDTTVVVNPPTEDLPAHDVLIGSLVGIGKNVRKEPITTNGNANTTLYNLPLFWDGHTESEWWDNLVEEYAYSGMDYLMVNCRGVLPDSILKLYPGKYYDHGDPRHIQKLIEAMERRGVADKFKIAVFDDCPASWAAARNGDLYNKYSPLLTPSVYDYPLDNLDGEGGIYKYIWDYNIKIAFRNIPDKYLLKFQGRPVLFLWSVNGSIADPGRSDYNGKLAKILNRIREDFKKEFGVDPFLVADHAFNHRDKTVDYPVVDGMNNWFGMDSPYTMRTVNGVTIGVGIPGFSVDDKHPTNNHMLVDAKHGQVLDLGLQRMISSKSNIILFEGFTDVYENAALWRSTDTKYYDYPNQRLNILRKNSRYPYPKDFKVEAEACDYYKDNTAGNSGNAFREGDLDVKKCTDTYGGWQVTNTAEGEWLQWKELPLRAKSTFKLRYSSSAVAKVCFSIDEKDCAEVELSSTSGAWTTVDAGTVALNTKGRHDVVLKVLSGNIDINYFNIVAAE